MDHAVPPSGRRSRAALVVAFGALAAGLAVWWLVPSHPEAPVVPIDAAPDTEGRRPTLPGAYDKAPVGGIYAGTVVDRDDRPVIGADVLLTAFVDSEVSLPSPVVREKVPGEAQGDVPTFKVKKIGDRATVAHQKTDREGRFRLVGGSHKVIAIFAGARGYSVAMKAHLDREPLLPGDGHVIRLPDAGWLEGTVTDAETKAPVPRAEVEVIFQGRAHQGGIFGPVAATPTDQFPEFQEYILRELGPMLWGSEFAPGDQGFRLVTGQDGAFRFGPVMSEVQVEVVVTHRDYMWTETDTQIPFESEEAKKAGAQGARVLRPVVKPGETLQRTYALVKGKEVRGVVKDDTGTPLEDVEVAVRHVVQMQQHRWYRAFPRTARTDSKGRFRVAGLSWPHYELTMTHPSFEKRIFPHVAESPPGDTYDRTYLIEAEGWIEGEVEGGPADRPIYYAKLFLSPTGVRKPDVPYSVNVAKGKFELPKAPAGAYRAWLTAGSYVSEAIDLVVEPRNAATARFRLGLGGGVEFSVRDREGRALDPATATFQIREASGAWRNAGKMVSRGGLLKVGGMRPGRYRGTVHVVEYADVETPEFDVAEDRETRLEPLVLRRPASLQIVGIEDDQGRPVESQLSLQVASGGGDFVPTRTNLLGRIDVAPGSVRVRATTEDGRSFEETYEVEDGAVVPVKVKVSR